MIILDIINGKLEKQPCKNCGDKKKNRKDNQDIFYKTIHIIFNSIDYIISSKELVTKRV